MKSYPDRSKKAYKMRLAAVGVQHFGDMPTLLKNSIRVNGGCNLAIDSK